MEDCSFYSSLSYTTSCPNLSEPGPVPLGPPDCLPLYTCSSCAVSALSVQLLYWPSTVVQDNGICPENTKNGTQKTYTATPTGSGPNTKIWDESLTPTSPTAYLSFSGVGVSWCGSQRSLSTSTVIPIDPHNVSSLRQVVCPVAGEPYGGGYIDGTYVPASFDFRDLNTPMPWNAWLNGPYCKGIDDNPRPECQTMTPSDFAPIVAYPQNFLSYLGPIYAGCDIAYDYKGVYDPPHALEPQPSAAAPEPHTSASTSLHQYTDTTPSPRPVPPTAPRTPDHPNPTSPPVSRPDPSSPVGSNTPSNTGRVGNPLLGKPSDQKYSSPHIASNSPDPPTTNSDPDRDSSAADPPGQYGAGSKDSNAAAVAGSAIASILDSPQSHVDPQGLGSAVGSSYLGADGTDGHAASGSYPTEDGSQISPNVESAGSLGAVELAHSSDRAGSIIGNLGLLEASDSERSTAGRNLLSTTASGASDPVGAAMGDYDPDSPSQANSPQGDPAKSEVQIGGQTYPVSANGGTIKIGSQSLSQGGASIIVKGHTVSWIGSGLVVDGRSTIPLPQSPTTTSTSNAKEDLDALISLGSTTLAVIYERKGAVVVGRQTLSGVGSSITMDGGTSGLQQGGIVFDRTSTVPLFTSGSTNIDGSDARAVLALGSNTITATRDSNGTPRMGTATLSINGAAITIDGHTLSDGENGIIIDGTTTASWQTLDSSLSIGREAVQLTAPDGKILTAVANSDHSGFAIVDGSITLSLGGPAITIEGETLSLASAGLVVDGSTTRALPVPEETNALIWTSSGGAATAASAPTASEGGKGVSRSWFVFVNSLGLALFGLIVI
ncbi:MAG: hypothetical protein Q9157_003360 [Trypethelium eluteriae]